MRRRQKSLKAMQSEIARLKKKEALEKQRADLKKKLFNLKYRKSIGAFKSVGKGLGSATKAAENYADKLYSQQSANKVRKRVKSSSRRRPRDQFGFDLY